MYCCQGYYSIKDNGILSFLIDELKPQRSKTRKAQCNHVPSSIDEFDPEILEQSIAVRPNMCIMRLRSSINLSVIA